MVTRRILIQGVVQGVGFRPFVYQHAQELGLTGYVTNTEQGVEIVGRGTTEALEELVRIIRSTPPPQSVIETLESETVDDSAFSAFTIKESRTGGDRVVRISRDLAVCDDCREELFDQGNRRAFYPFINCTNCGPRFTIVKDIPYDRVKTTMAAFTMCRECEQEYADPNNRRFHAQPNACHACGPRTALVSNSGETLQSGGNRQAMRELIEKTAALLEGGAIIGIKGLGGYRVACNAALSRTVGLLRLRKRREEKPFALMVRDIAMAETIADVGKREAERLQEVDTPILLLPKRLGHGLAEETASRSADFGVMLPGTPFEHLLFSAINFPLVMTSANFNDEPIIYKDGEALSYLQPICDYFLTGERPIFIRTDDSVLRLFRGKDYLIRRSRGAVPAPVTLGLSVPQPILAVGAELKNTICLSAGDAAYLSQHIGDLKNRETYQAFIESIGHFIRLLEVRPAVIAHDLHPQYLSTQFTADPPPGFDWVVTALKIPVQHHHAHIASCMAENRISGPVIGVALDGTGYGPDGTVWGGEILVADGGTFTRRAHLELIAMPGGDLAIKEPWRMAVAYLCAVYGEKWREALTPALSAIPEQKLIVTGAQLATSTSLPLTSSCGRLFDAVSALSGVCLEARYEGQPAIEFEQARSGDAGGGYRFPILERHEMLVISWREMFRQAIEDIRQGKKASFISDRFHAGLAQAITETVRRLARETGIRQVVLSGGCFMNMTLLRLIVEELEANALVPVYHSHIPCNDGGIALGQTAVAAARLTDVKRDAVPG